MPRGPKGGLGIPEKLGPEGLSLGDSGKIGVGGGGKVREEKHVKRE